MQPYRWKVFQVLKIEGENAGNGARRNVEGLLISDADFKRWLDRHNRQKSLVAEDNKTMRNSYLLLDEFMRLLDCSTGAKVPSKSILDVGVDAAVHSVCFDSDSFIRRKGDYFVDDIEDIGKYGHAREEQQVRTLFCFVFRKAFAKLCFVFSFPRFLLVVARKRRAKRKENGEWEH